MANLEVTFAGVRMRNPIGVAMLGSPSPIGHIPQRHADFLMRYVDAGAGYVSVPAVILERKRPEALDRFKGHVRGGWKLQKAATKGFATREGLFACAYFEQIPTYLDEALELMTRLKPQLPDDVPMIVSIEGFGADTEKWTELAKILDQEGADMIELNMSCPLPMMGDISKEHTYSTDIPPELSPEMESLGLSAILGDTPSAIGPIVKGVVDSVRCPVGVKPSPEAGFPRIVAILKTIANNGAKYVININNPITIAPPDIYNGGRGKYPVFGDLNPMAAIIGPMNRYQTLKCLAAGGVFVPELEYGAVGGIVTPEIMVEMMMLGARQVQISSALYWEGIRVIPRFVSFLETYMDKQGYQTPDDFIGLGRQYIRPIDDDTDFYAYQAVASADKGACTQCGKCAPTFCFAISRGEEGYPLINQEECIACGMCSAICPSEAISIVDRS